MNRVNVRQVLDSAISGFYIDQGEFKNRRKSRSRRNEAEVFFAPNSASLLR